MLFSGVMFCFLNATMHILAKIALDVMSHALTGLKWRLHVAVNARLVAILFEHAVMNKFIHVHVS